MSKCWCGSTIDPKGRHLDVPPQRPWCNSYFRKDQDGYVIHEREKPGR